MFLYFLPTASQAPITRRDLPPALAYAFDSGPPLQTGCSSGPDSKAGKVLTARRPGIDAPGYYPNDQLWRRIPMSDCFVGISKADLPRLSDRDLPQLLQRPELVTGKDIVDALDRRWHIPFAMNWVEFENNVVWLTNLPRRFSLDEGTGKWIVGNEVMPRYVRLWDLTNGYLAAENEAIIAAEAEAEAAGEEKNVRFSFDGVDDLALEALALNYRIGSVELDLLGIYERDFRGRIIDVIRGMPLLVEIKKKRDRLIGGSSPPASESITDSPPLSPPSSGNVTPPANIGSI